MSYFLKVGPVYRHFVEHRFRVAGVWDGGRLIERLARFGRVEVPRPFHGRVRLILNATQLREVGLLGSRLVLQLAGRRYSVWYRSAHPRSALRETTRLLNKLRPRRLGLRVQLRRRRTTYFEIFASVPKTSAELLRTVLPAADEPSDQSLRRAGIKTLYARTLLLPIGLRGHLRCAVVLYHPRRSRTPRYMKLEVKAPLGRRRVLSQPIRNELIGYLRHLLAESSLQAVAKPAIWTGTIVDRRQHIRGGTQKKVLTLLRAAPYRSLSLATLSARLPGISRRNLLESIRLLAKVGMVALDYRKRRIRTVHLIDFSTVAPIDTAGRSAA
jgi:hypothetical protein